jgi:hypothetical protein
MEGINGNDELTIVNIKGITLNLNEIKDVKFKEAVPASPGKLQTKVISGSDIYKYKIYLKQSGNINSAFSNSLAYQGKPYVVEINPRGGSPDSTADKIKKALRLAGNNSLDVQFKTTIDLIGDNYTEFTDACSLEKFVVNSEYPDGGYWEKVSGGIVGSVLPENGFGTYESIMKNINLPTCANTGLTALHQDEMPVIGGLYDQFIITYSADRGSMGTSAVGANEVSTTTHVLWVKQEFSENFQIILGIKDPEEAGE